MRVQLEIDTSAGEGGYRAASDVLARLFGFAAETAPLAPATATVAPPQAPARAPIPAPGGAPPAAAPIAPAPPAPSVSAPPMAPAPVAPSPIPAPATAPAPPAPAGGVTAAAFGEAVQKYASMYTAKGAKARFAEMAAAFGQPSWVSTSAIPPDRLADVLPWFATA